MRRKRFLGVQRRGKARLKAIPPVLAGIAVGALVTVLFSCPNPIGDILAKQIADADVPNIAVTWPADGGVYGGTVVIEGSVVDAGGDVKSLQVSVPKVELNEAVELGEGGAFSYSFTNHGITETILITLTAKDWNGNKSSETITLFNDETGPYINITEPEDFSAYSTVVRVSGTVTDTAGVSTTSEVSACSYSIPGTSLADELSLGSDGAFSFEFVTRNPDGTQVLEGPATIEISAEDWNGNTTTADVTVVRSETGDFASVTITPANKQLTIDWETVLHAESYRIHNPRYGEIREDVSSPYVWDGLTNGELCSIQLQAVIPDETGEDGWSDIQEVIPLSKRTLAPWIGETGYKTLTIEWNGIPAASEYIVERRKDEESWSIHTITSATSLIDRDLIHNSHYYYRITPLEQSSIISGYAEGVPGRFGPRSANSVRTKDLAYGVAVEGAYAYVADSASGLAIIDISDPAKPGSPNYVAIDYETYDVTVDGTYAYVAAGDVGLAIIDISDPSNPGIPFYADTSGYARDVTVQGSFAYVADESSGLSVIDISNPENPGLPIYVDMSGEAYSVSVTDSYAYVADFTGGLAIIDISDPTNPGTPVYKSINGYAYGITVVDSYAYLAESSSGLAIIDISDPHNPGTPLYQATNGDSVSVDVSGHYAYVGDSYSGLAIIDISEPTNPGTPVYISTNDCAKGVIVAGFYAYVADFTAGLAIIDISNPFNPCVPDYITTENAHGIAIADSKAYVADWSNGLAIIDISDPENPSSPVYVNTDGDARDVTVAGSYAYVADNTKGLAIVDISDPTNPSDPVYADTSGYAHDVSIAGSYAYVADWNSGLAIIDISDPTNPGIPIYADNNDYVYGVDVKGSFAYAAESSKGLAIIEISDPEDPSSPEYVNTDGDARDVTVAGSYAYVALWNSDLAIIDISDPTNPGTPVYAESGQYSNKVSVSGSYAYVAEDMAIIDISDPTNPAVPVYMDITPVRDVTIVGSYAYLAYYDPSDSSSGIAISKLWETPPD